MKKTTILQQLRASGLQPTVSRLGILQAIGSRSPQAICAEEVLHSMLLRGIHTTMSTVYRGIRLLQDHGLLLRIWSDERKALYQLKPADQGVPPLRLVCSESGKSVLLYDEKLHQYLAAMAEREGLDISGKRVSIHIGRLDCTHDAPLLATHGLAI